MKLLNLINMASAKLKRDKNQEMLQDMITRAGWLGVNVKETDLAYTSGRLAIGADEDYEIIQFEVEYRPSLSTEEKLMALAHELGHAWQFLGECDADYREWIIYQEINNALLIEEDAWLRSIKLLHEVGFDNWKTFELFAVNKFASYIYHTEKDMNKVQTRAQQFMDSVREQVKKEVMYVTA